MPTPSGLLKVGDVIQDKEGTQFRVMHRTGNGQDYSVRVERVDGKHHPAKGRSWLILEVAYWLQNGDLKLVDNSQAKILDALCAANPDITRPRLDKIMRLTLQMAGKK